MGDVSRAAVGLSETERIALAMTACTLPKPEWTHHAHLRAGLWHVVTFGEDQALVLLRERITRYNTSVGTANTDTSGYHETLTRFYVGLIAGFVRGRDCSVPLDDLAAALIAEHGDRELPLRFYSRERLFSVGARRGWMEPDLPKPEVRSPKPEARSLKPQKPEA